MKLCYADPPYIGCAHYYPEKTEVDHNDLMAMMCQEYEGWALSCSSSSLKLLLSYPSCPEDIRIASWVKPFAVFKANVNPAYAWEPVLFWGGRKKHGRDVPTIRDWVSVNITKEKGLMGAKPIKFCYWVFHLLGAQPGDELIDLYPGTGIVGRAWENFNKRMSVKNLPMFEGALTQREPDSLKAGDSSLPDVVKSESNLPA